MSLETGERNPRGIPKAPFIVDVDAHLGGPDGDAEGPLKAIQESIGKYRYMDANLTQRRQGLEEKIPDIKKTLSMVQFLSNQHSEHEDEEDGGKLKTSFELNDTLFAEAELEDTDTVFLWLGANVMLSYKIPAAIELLKSKLKAAEKSLANTEEDLEFLREQLTVMEVNMARVYNADVKRRREKRLKEGEKDGG
ncbi:hypothetical protein E1B28_003478 [Marasmius oreades]|uniref:Prefoldin subunit 3 n=1 Tax=Marasmius oreades TaxID=181124 RepID=A0A9P7RLJ8_9AGAR|nr:uncharacterized protein E1B28_003462 [Marasmius oreades]XP_043002421.1 uncharacterized protein E1B28_003478 [Marasmius oreades]KAG7085931.1 hypothetical protein E1B28_003462 [Marasmius oreades]KAG7085950.1 hypothetical protein E1B28_003478 [Marasmius oreades]